MPLKAFISRGVIYFGSGGALGFDTLAAELVLELKLKYPFVKLIMVYPCHDQTKYWSANDIKRYERIKQHCDKFVYTSESYSRDCMLKRNRHLVDNSGYCICYLTQKTGGTAYTVEYAERMCIHISNVAR